MIKFKNTASPFLFVLIFSLIIAIPSCKEEGGVDGPAIIFEAEMTLATYFTTARNKIKNPVFKPNSITPSIGFKDFSDPQAGMIATNYKGALDSISTPWFANWSFYEQLLLGNNSQTLQPKSGVDTLQPGPTGSRTLNQDTVYILNGRVYVEDGATLTIPAGTIIKGMPGDGSAASVLIVSRGGKIMANGNGAQPIIFTFANDSGGTSPTARGKWGGLIILGKAKLNSTPGETAVDGIPETDFIGLYGGNNDNDNSGVLRFVSIRHAGKELSNGKEINGLTLAGVGNATTIEFVEVIGAQDDGIQWFGGTVDGNHLISAYSGDDGLDYGEGYTGKNQFLVVHQAADVADRGGEHSGGTNPETGTPFSTPSFYNVTSIGNVGSRALTFKDNAGGEYHNSIFVDYLQGVDIEIIPEDMQHSFRMFETGLLNLQHNVFYNIGAGSNPSDIFTITSP